MGNLTGATVDSMAVTTKESGAGVDCNYKARVQVNRTNNRYGTIKHSNAVDSHLSESLEKYYIGFIVSPITVEDAVSNDFDPLRRPAHAIYSNISRL